MTNNENDKDVISVLMNHRIKMGQLITLIDRAVNVSKYNMPYGQVMELTKAIDDIKTESNDTFDVIFKELSKPKIPQPAVDNQPSTGDTDDVSEDVPVDESEDSHDINENQDTDSNDDPENYDNEDDESDTDRDETDADVSDDVSDDAPTGFQNQTPQSNADINDLVQDLDDNPDELSDDGVDYSEYDDEDLDGDEGDDADESTDDTDFDESDYDVNEDDSDDYPDDDEEDPDDDGIFDGKSNANVDDQSTGADALMDTSIAPSSKISTMNPQSAPRSLSLSSQDRQQYEEQVRNRDSNRVIQSIDSMSFDMPYIKSSNASSESTPSPDKSIDSDDSAPSSNADSNVQPQTDTSDNSDASDDLMNTSSESSSDTSSEANDSDPFADAASDNVDPNELDDVDENTGGVSDDERRAYEDLMNSSNLSSPSSKSDNEMFS